MYASYILTSCLAAIAAAKTIPVSVSNATIGLVFTPASLTADVGDVVTFHFFPRNHSVAQGSLEAPCKPLAANSFFSGFVPIANGTSNTTFSITIADKNPIWYYCSQAKHCNAGMAGVINPPAGKSIQDYIVAAANATVVSPAVAAGHGGALSGAGGSAAASGSASSAVASASSSAAAAASKTASGSAAASASGSATAKSSAAATATGAAVAQFKAPAMLALAAGAFAVL